MASESSSTSSSDEDDDHNIGYHKHEECIIVVRPNTGNQVDIGMVHDIVDQLDNNNLDNSGGNQGNQVGNQGNQAGNQGNQVGNQETPGTPGTPTPGLTIATPTTQTTSPRPTPKINYRNSEFLFNLECTLNKKSLSQPWDSMLQGLHWEDRVQ